MKLIDKDALVAEIEKRKIIVEKRLYINNSYSKEGNAAWERDKALYDAYNSLFHFIDSIEVKELPIWKKVSPDTGQTTLYKDGDKSYLERFGYRIDLKDLDKLPKKNLKAQKGE